MVFFFVLLAVTILSGITLFQLRKKRLLQNVKHFASPNQLPILGIGSRFIGRNTKGIMEAFDDLIIDAGNTPCWFWLGPTLVIAIGKAEDMQTVLNSANCLSKPYVYQYFGNDGLFSSPAHKWKSQRKLLNPSFNTRILSSFIPIFNEKTNILCRNIENMLAKNETFDVLPIFYACTLEMITATSLGYDVEVQNNKNLEFLESTEKLSEAIAERIVKVWMHPYFIFRFTNLYIRDAHFREQLYRLPKMIRKIKEKEYFSSKKHLDKEVDDESEFFTKPQIFVDELFKLYSKNQIDTPLLDDQILTMIVGGNETSALITSHAILLLAIYQDIQDKVFNEIKEAYNGEQMSESNTESIGKLYYLEMVIKETMRLFPVGPYLGRECQKDTPIRNGIIPKGALILLCFKRLHRDPEIWGSEADQFNPDNFLPEKCASRHQYAYLPFSGGPRNCIGVRYAWISMKIMLSALLRRYKFTTELKYEDITTKWDITLKFVCGHMVKVERRTDYDKS